MDKRKIALRTFVINVIALIATIVLGYLLIFKDLELTSKPLKIFLFLILIVSTIFGLYISMKNKIKPLTRYFAVLILTPIVLTAGSLVSGNGIILLQFGGQFIQSTFGTTEKLFEQNQFYIKRSFSLMSNQWYDLYENRGLFEKKLGKFNGDEDLNLAGFKIYDSLDKKYIRLVDTRQTVQVEEFTH